MEKITILILTALCAATTYAQDSYKEKTVFKNSEVDYGFSGDAFGSTNLLVFTNLSTQSATCSRMERFIREYDIRFFYPGHYHGNDVETPQRVSDIRAICEGVLDGTKTAVKGSNRSLPNMVEENGVKVNFSTPR